MADDLPFTNSLTTALAEIERLRAEVDDAHESRAECVKAGTVWRERAEQAEARLARVVEAATFACDEHEKEDGTDCHDCTGMVELRAALAAARPEEKNWQDCTCDAGCPACDPAQPEEGVSTAAVFGEAADRQDDLAAQPEEE